MFRYLSDQAIVVANFGQLLVNSRPRHKSKINVRQLYNQGSTDADIKELVLKEGFDRFDVELKAVQVCCQNVCSTLRHNCCL